MNITRNNRGFTGIMTTLSLILVFLSLLAGVLIFTDYAGILNLHQYIPESMKEYDIVKAYLRKATLMRLSDQEQIKELMHEHQLMFDEKLSELKILEHQLEMKRKGILNLEERYLTKKASLDSREIEMEERKKELSEQEKVIEKKKKELQSLEMDNLEHKERIVRLAKIYERMEPESAAKILDNVEPELFSEIIAQMKDKKAAEILNFVSPEKSAKIIK